MGDVGRWSKMDVFIVSLWECSPTDCCFTDGKLIHIAVLDLKANRVQTCSAFGDMVCGRTWGVSNRNETFRMLTYGISINGVPGQSSDDMHRRYRRSLPVPVGRAEDPTAWRNSGGTVTRRQITALPKCDNMGLRLMTAARLKF